MYVLWKESLVHALMSGKLGELPFIVNTVNLPECCVRLCKNLKEKSVCDHVAQCGFLNVCLYRVSAGNDSFLYSLFLFFFFFARNVLCLYVRVYKKSE